ncbi:MAG TPA: hypothetical protein VHX66_08185 [Solirubrobacteraceae bacterium]|jgi:hypothetical protein|nr:hypothetical protein [Solirubrobacteraceae bacterium]
MPLVLGKTAFVFEEREVAIGEIVLEAVRSGEWAALERELLDGIDRLRELKRGGSEIGDGDLRPPLVAWRRERRLLAAEDYHAWLAERELTIEEVSEHLRRHIAVERTGDQDRVQTTSAVLTAGAAHAEAILSGRLLAWTQRLARRKAARRALLARKLDPGRASAAAVEQLVEDAFTAQGAGAGAERAELVRSWASEVLELDAVWQRLTEEVAQQPAIERCVASHHLDWQLVEWQEATFAREDVAAEAALWVREDGAALASVAVQANGVCDEIAAYGYERPELASLLMGARDGELVGPVAFEDGWRLVQLRARKSPDAADPTLRARAIEELLEDALAPHLSGRVEWRAPL